ncbi:MAG: tetratricopeptide repeat protein [Hyphomicrobium sp.]
MRRAAAMLFAALVVLPSTGVAQAPAPEAAKADEAASNLLRGNVVQAVADYTEALKDTGLANDRRAALLNDRAVAYVRSGQPKLALEDYNRAVQIFAEYPAAYNNRGNLLLSLGQPNEAIKDFERAILLAPGYAAAYSNRAAARVRLGLYPDAIADFTKAIELLPASAPPLSGRGLAFLAIGKPHAAIRDFSRAVNADARFASAYRNRAEARLNVEQHEEAIEDLSRAIAFDPVNSEVYVVRGYAYLAVSNTASAIKDFARAIELDPKSASAHQGRGLANGLADAYEEAYGDLNRAIELAPRSAVAFAYRAFVYKQNGQPDIGQKDVDTAWKIDPESADVLWAKAEIEEARGQGEAAIVDLRKALAIKPGWRLATDAMKRLGAGGDVSEDREMVGLGVEGWRVVARANAYFAVADAYPALRVPLEMMGEGKPQLVAWELKDAPHLGYGVLTYSGGVVAGKSGTENTELAAIIDIETSKVIGIQPNKQGARVARWVWEDDRAQVASIDGVTDEFLLRATVAPPVAAAAPGQRRVGQKGPGWEPWNDPIGGVGSSRTEQRSAQRKSQKPKSLFDLLFNN